MTYVDPPRGESYSIPQEDWSALANLPSDFYQGAKDKQQYDLSRAFQGGLPMVNGQPDWRAIAQKLAQLGDSSDLPQLGQLMQPQQSPLLSGTTQPQSGNSVAPLPFNPQAAAAPISMPSAAASIPTGAPPTAGAPVGASGGSGGDNVAELVAAALPGSAQTPAVAANIAKALKVDPDTPLTPDQQATAQRYLNGYLSRTGNTPRGIRNDNPGNIEDGSFARSQPGYVGTEPQGRYAQFATPQDGKNAASHLLAGYGAKGINTVNAIVSTWAPASDGNNPQNYAAFVAKQLGVDPNQPLDMKNPQVLQTLATAMAKFENGVKNVPSSATGSPQPQPLTEGGPSLPQVRLPPGAKDAQQGIDMYDAEIAKYSGAPNSAGIVDALKDERDRLADSISAKYDRIGTDQYGQPTYGWINAATQTVRPAAGGTATAGPSAASNLTGDDYLKTLDQSRANQVKALADGRMAFPSGFALKSPYWQQMLQAVSQYDPSFDAVQYNARSRARSDATSGKLAQNNNALNTGIGHIGQLADAVAGLHNVSWSQSANAVKNWLGSEFGGTGPTNFEAIKNRVAPEIVKIWRGTGGAEADIKRDLDSLSDAKTPAQLYGALQEIAGLMQSKIAANRAQYDSAMGPNGLPLHMITPQSQATLDRLDHLAEGDAAPPETASAPGQLGKPDKDGWITLPNGGRIQESQ
jgi:hypothetical protein